MIKTILILIVSMGIPTLVNAATGLIFGDSQFQAKPHLVIALQDNHPTTGTDSGTTSYPNAGINTEPTKGTGTETNAERPPWPLPDTPPPPNAPIPPTPSGDANQ